MTLSERSNSAVKAESRDEKSHLAVVACGPRLEETITMLKSAVLFSKKPLHFYIFAEDELHKSFRNTVSICGFICYVSQPISTHSPTVPLEFFFIHAVQLHNNGHLRPLYSTEKSLIVFEKTLGNQQVKNKQTKRISVTKCILKGILAALACRNIPED